MKAAAIFCILFFFNISNSFCQEKDELKDFLENLKKEKPDSTKVWNRTFYGNGKIRTESVSYYSHFRPYDLKEFIKKDSLTVIRKFRRNGSLEEKGILYSNYDGPGFSNTIYNRQGIKTKKEYFDVDRGESFSSFQGNTDEISLIRRDIIIYDDNGDEKIQKEPSKQAKWKVFVQRESLKLTNKEWTEELKAHENLKYAVFEKRGNSFLINIIDPANDSVITTIPWKFTNTLFDSKIEKEIANFFFNYISVVPDQALIYSKDKKYIFYDYRLRKRFESKFLNRSEYVENPEDKKIYMVLCSPKCGLFDLIGRELISQKYEEIRTVGDGLIASLKNKKVVIYDFEGNVVTPSYRTLIVSENEIIEVKGIKNQNNSILNSIYLDKETGDTIKVLYSEKDIKSKNYVLNYKGDYGLVGKEGNWLVKPQSSVMGIKITDDGFVLLEVRNSDASLLNGNLRQILYEIREDTVNFEKNKGFLLDGYPNLDPNYYKYVLYDLTRNKQDTLTSLRFLDNQILTSFDFEDDYFKNGYIKVSITRAGNPYSSYYNFLSKDGKLVSPKIKYNKIHTDFNQYGQAVVSTLQKNQKRTEERFCVIDTAGNEIIPCNYTSYRLHEDGYILKQANDKKFGLVSFDQRTLMNFKYESVDDLEMNIYNPYVYYEEIEMDLHLDLDFRN